MADKPAQTPQQTPEEKALEEYKKNVDDANKALASVGLDVGSQIILTLADGQQIPVVKIESTPVVIKPPAPIDEQQPPNDDAGKGPDKPAAPAKS